MCGCAALGTLCGDCQMITPGLAARASWPSPTNYDPTLHRRYAPGMGAVVPFAQTNASVYQREQPPGLGQVVLGWGWTLGDAASLALVVLAGLTIYKEFGRRR